MSFPPRAPRYWRYTCCGARGTRCWKRPAAPAALAVAAAHGGRIDLLLTDVMMPGMSGADLAERMWADSPGLAVLYMSGHAEVLVTDGKGKGRAENFLAKPFSLAAFIRKVREVLDARP